MRVMCIGHVRMRVVQRLVAVRVTVVTGGHHVVVMIMVSIVVPMRMLVLHRPVLVLVPVRREDVKDYTGEHQQTT